MKPLIPVLSAAVVLVACGVGAGPELGDFPPITKKQTDAPFTLTAPSSRSPAAFRFTSSNPAVATINGAVVTIQGVGTSTITAAQDGIGSYGPTEKSTTLTVEAGSCDANQVKVDGTCTVIPTCVPPAAVTNNQCVAPATSATFIKAVSLTWMGTSRSDTWTNARDFCNGSVINGQTGWRLPTQAELSALYDLRTLSGRGWLLGATWSSTKGTTMPTTGHVAVNLGTGEKVDQADTTGAYVSCVR